MTANNTRKFIHPSKCRTQTITKVRHVKKCFAMGHRIWYQNCLSLRTNTDANQAQKVIQGRSTTARSKDKNEENCKDKDKESKIKHI